MSRHRPIRRRSLRIWMSFNAIVVLALAGWILRPTANDPDTAQQEPTISAENAAQAAKPAPTKQDILDITGIRFGISAPQAPWSSSEIDALSGAAGVHPTLVQFFVKWNEEFRPDSIPQTYKQGALPVISWEPWAGLRAGRSQPAYSLAKIASGQYDTYIKRFATGIKDQRWPVGIRFAHEMNGNWYPWSEQQPPNHLGDYVKAWRHVHDVFAALGATNVIWIWSPNITRPLPKISISQLYPGDDYVDWIGMVGYAVEESTAGAVYQSTMTTVRTFTQKPFLITETGAHPGPHQVAWVTDLFKWLPQHPDVIGFIWFEFSESDGGTADWRFTAHAATTKAFRDGLASVQLAPPPPH